jgi:hypothetical protein
MGYQTCTVHPAASIVGACERCGDFGCRDCIPGGRFCVRCVPAPAFGGTGYAEKLDLGKAFNWVFKDPDWVSKVLAGAACLLLSFFLVPALLLFGYHLRIARRERQQPQGMLPAWDDWGSLAVDGIKLYVTIMLPVLLIEFVVFVLVAIFIGIMVAVGAGSGSGSGSGPNAAAQVGVILGMFGFFGAILLVIPMALLFAYAWPALQLQYLRTGSMLSGLQFRAIWRLMSKYPGPYFELFIGGFAARFVANLLGQLLCLIGILATTPWALYTEGYMLGRYWAWLDAQDAVNP